MGGGISAKPLGVLFRVNLNKDKTLILLKGFGIVVISYSSFILCGYLFSSLFGSVNNKNVQILFVYQYLCSMFLVIYFAKKIFMQELETSFNNSSFNSKLVISTIFVGVSFYFASMPLSEIVPLDETELKNIISQIGQNDFGFILLALLIGPILEEYLFRGILLRSLLTKYSKIFSVVFTAFLFSLLHLTMGLPIVTFLFSIVAGWLFIKTRSIILCIILHSINNGLGQIHKHFVLSVDRNLLTGTEIVGSDYIYYAVVIFSMIIFTALMIILNKSVVLKNKNS